MLDHDLYLLVPIFLALWYLHLHMMFVLFYHAQVSLFGIQSQPQFTLRELCNKFLNILQECLNLKLCWEGKMFTRIWQFICADLQDPEKDTKSSHMIFFLSSETSIGTQRIPRQQISCKFKSAEWWVLR